MSNRENLRRIAALSLVIAFGMSGAAGLADEQPNTSIEEPTVEHAKLTIYDTKLGDFTSVEGETNTYAHPELTLSEDEPCTALFSKFWSFSTGNEETPVLPENVAMDEDGFLTFAAAGEYKVKFYAKDHQHDEDEFITLIFNVKEAETPVVEHAKLSIDDIKLGDFTPVEGETNTYAYPELTFSEDEPCTAFFSKFWSFSTGAEETSVLPENVTMDEAGVLTFAAAGEYKVKFYAKDHQHDEDEFITLVFNVKNAPEKTKEPDEPYYPPVDPVTPAPTATPTATPAPTETPAPTDAPTDAPTSEPTAAPDVEMQVSAGGKRLNVRSGAGIGNSIIARLNDGSKVTVLLVEGDWSYIRATVNGNVIEGYVSSQYLKEISTVEPTEPANARVSTSGGALRLRSRASLNAPIITRMPNGSSLKVLETVNGWCRVQFTAANGTVHEGWASSQYITVIA